MKRTLIVWMCLASLVVMAACGGKTKQEQVIDGFEELIKEVEKKKGELTAEEWKKMSEDFNKRFEALGVDKIEADDFSALQKVKLVALTARWTKAMAEFSGSLMKGLLEEAEKKNGAGNPENASGESAQ